MHEYLDPLIGTPETADASTRLTHAEVMAGIAICLACAETAWLIFACYHRGRLRMWTPTTASVPWADPGRGRSPALQVPGLVALLALFVLLCGVANLGATLHTAPPPERLVSTAMKVVGSLVWVIVAARLPSLLGNPREDSARAPRPLPPDGPTPTRPDGALQEHALGLECRVRDGDWLLDRTHALRDLRKIFEDLETPP